MKKLLLFPILLLSIATLSAQDSTLNMSSLYNWRVDTLPTASGIRYNDIWGYVDCDRREYAITGSAAYVHFHEVTNPANACEIAAFAGGQTAVWRDMKTYRDRAYAVSDGTTEGLMIFDLSGLPDTVVKTYQSNEFFNNAHNIFIDEANARLYAVSTPVANMVVLDISNPDQPSLLANVSLGNGGNAHDVYVRNNIAYVSQEWRGFYSWDMTDPTNPVLLGSVQTGGYNHSSWLTEDGRYALYAEEVPDGLPLGFIDLQAPGGFEVINTFKFPLLAPAAINNTPHNPFIRGKYAIVSYYHDGLQIFDIEDVMNPKQVAFYDTHDNTTYSGYQGNWGAYPFLPSGHILASDISRGLFVLSADSIDLKAIPGGTPDATLTVDGMESFCEGDSTRLVLPDNASSFSWYQDDQLLDNTTHDLIVDESGTYYAVASNGHCLAVSTPVEISEKPKPDLSNLPSGDTILCPGEQVLMSGPLGMDYYIWTNNGDVLPNQSNSLPVSSTGTYQLLAFLNGCSSSSEEFSVTTEETPTVNLEYQSNEVCFGTGDTVFLFVSPANLRYDWTLNGDLYARDTNQIMLEFAPVDTIRYQASSQNCTFEPVIYQLDPPRALIPTITQSGDTLYASDASSYQWYRNGEIIAGATNSFYVPETSGDYSVVILDNQGCSASSQEVTIIISSTDNRIALEHTKVNPNPFTTELSIRLADLLVGTTVNLSLYGNEGRLLDQRRLTSAPPIIQWDLSEIPAGFYWLQIQDQNGNGWTEKVVKF